MITLPAPYRRAALGDAPSLAELVNFAGEGMPYYLWKRMAKQGETAREVGQSRAEREQGSFSYRNAIVADDDGGAVAALVGYKVADEPEPTDDLPPMFVPLQELENLVCSTWYVNVLAAYPDHRKLRTWRAPPAYRRASRRGPSVEGHERDRLQREPWSAVAL